MGIEQPTVGRETALENALQRIGEDIKLYPVGFSVGSGNMATKQEVYERLFGREARHGTTKIVHGKRQHVQGWYEKFPSLPHSQIDVVLDEHTIKFASARIPTYFKINIEKDLRNLATATRSK